MILDCDRHDDQLSDISFTIYDTLDVLSNVAESPRQLCKAGISGSNPRGGLKGALLIRYIELG
jgi:hypothetical protein